MGVDNPGRGGL